GSVKIFSAGSALDEGPSIYLGVCRCGKDAPFRETASFNPFTESGGVRVATTSTTTGANLLVSGSVSGKTKASVIKYDFVRPTPSAKTLEPVRIGEVWTGNASSPAALGGN
ncbi:MAG: copper oxidase, partial [Leptolyngbya sp.]|nr:copper oxidase [Candidatus Melainabacteria bacterium]